MRNSAVSCAFLIATIAGCSGSGSTGASPSAGGVSAGGSANTGGSTGSGATLQSGGAVTSGGSSNSAGTVATGGQLAGGGSSTTSGGSALAGGTSSAGGTAATGGSKATGGTSSTGGSPVAGGTSSAGGTSATGGSEAAGGTRATGGSKAVGGSSATGGSKTVGGTSATGGTSESGGTSATGGSKPTGGSSATGGSKATCTSAATLKEAATCAGILIGTAISSSHTGESGYATAAREFNYATAENEMKWDTTESSRNSFNFSGGDSVVSFASQNSMKVKGHTLVWHSQLPSWVSSLSNATDVQSVMVNHIQTEMNHYKGKVVAWDVVNEAWDTPSKKGDGTATMRNSVFYKYIGASYIDIAFQTARAADSNARLYYNDYSTEGMNDKSNAVYTMVKDMVNRGIPIDGVGMQMHIGTPNDSPTAAEVAQNMQRIADLGLEIVISEMDINMCDGLTLDQEKTLYHDIVAACVAQPACKAITVWGVTDKYSWINSFSESGCGSKSPTPLLWDSSYAKKPAYTGVLNALLGQ